MREYDRVLPKTIHKKMGDATSLSHSQEVPESVSGQSMQSESSFVTYKQESRGEKRSYPYSVCKKHRTTRLYCVTKRTTPIARGDNRSGRVLQFLHKRPHSLVQAHSGLSLSRHIHRIITRLRERKLRTGIRKRVGPKHRCGIPQNGRLHRGGRKTLRFLAIGRSGRREHGGIWNERQSGRNERWGWRRFVLAVSHNTTAEVTLLPFRRDFPPFLLLLVWNR